MGEIHSPAAVLPMTAVFTRHPQALAWVRERIARDWGEIILESAGFPFQQTRYYDASMGAGLTKYFFAMQPLVEPSVLVEMKHQSNAWEEEFAALARERWPGEIPEARPVNIDPGYVDLGKLVLASTKDYAHRLYMARGIYAEITLFYRHGAWQGHPWTFPDYGCGAYDDFLNQCREVIFRARKK